MPLDLQAEYDNRARVPDHLAIMTGWARDAMAWRAAAPLTELDLPYGPGARERLDIFWPGRDRTAPLALFIHGGYWQALDKSWFSHCARGLNARGVGVAIPSYDLCPSVALVRIVEEIRNAVIFLHRRHPRPLVATGHSAGGHLSAMLLATHWPRLDARMPTGLVLAAVPISGVFELEPLLSTTIGAPLRLSRESARVLSPRYLTPPRGTMHAIVGGSESAEFIRQTRDFAAAWGGTWEALEGRNHFTVLAPLADPESALVARLAALCWDTRASPDADAST